MAKLAVALGLKFTIKKTIFEQFCGGETIEECDQAIAGLAKSGIGTILDYSVEGEESEATFDQTCAEILKTIQRAKGNSDIPFSVFKTTGVFSSDVLTAASEIIEKNQIVDIELIENHLMESHKQDWRNGCHRFNQLCENAANSEVQIFVDAEESWLQPAIDLLATSAMHKYNQTRAWVFNTLQMYRHDRLSYLQNQVAEGRCQYGYKLVRGAYIGKGKG